MHRNDPAALRAVLLVAVFALACGSSGSSSSNDNNTPPPDGGTVTPTGTDNGTPSTASTLKLWPVPPSKTLTADQKNAFGTDGRYMNAHTPANPGGEIRGQLDKKGTLRVATLDAAQEVPPTTSSAFGASAIIVDESTGKVSGFIVTSGLTGTAAHIHQGARGSPGPVIVPMKGSGADGVWIIPDNAAPLTADQLAAWKAGNLYVNVHTQANPGGEIRGQLDKDGPSRVASMTSGQETPPNASTANGSGILLIDSSSSKPGGFMITQGLTATAAHVHQGAAGTPGAVVIPFTGGPNLWVVPDAAGAVASAVASAFPTNGLYMNAHTQANPGGEIRGQLDRGGDARMASADASQETPPNGSTALGGGVLYVDSGSGDVGGFFLTTGLSGATAAHVHQAARGTPGPVILPFTGP